MTRSTAAAKFIIGDDVICIADSSGIDAEALKDQFGSAWKHQVVSGVVTDIVAGDGRLPDHYFVEWDVGGSKKRAQVTARVLTKRVAAAEEAPAAKPAGQAGPKPSAKPAAKPSAKSAAPKRPARAPPPHGAPPSKKPSAKPAAKPAAAPQPDSGSSSEEDSSEDEDGGEVPEQGVVGPGCVDIEHKNWKKTIKWRTEPDGVPVDWRTEPTYEPTIHWRDDLGRGNERSPFEYWLHMFPVGMLPAIARASTASLPSGRREITEYEVLQVFGYFHAMTLSSQPGRRATYWAQDGDGDAPRLFPAPDFGKWGMTSHRFEEVLGALRLGDYDDGDETADRWVPVRSFIDAFNERMVWAVSPGHHVEIDESMSAWRGLGGHVLGGLPHVQKIARKPQGVGLELMDLADAKSRIIIRVEMVEGKAAAPKKFDEPGVPKGTSFAVRITEAYHGSGRIVGGDSAFGSLATAVALKTHGLYFQGMLKQAHAGVPKAHLMGLSAEGMKRGDTVTMSSAVDGHKVMIHMWHDKGKTPEGKDTGKRILVVATCGSTAPGQPHAKVRYRNTDDGAVRYTKEVPQTLLLNDYFRAAPAIDIHNHYRQSQRSLGLEKAWLTKKWWHRVLATMLGVVTTNAYLAYVRFHPTSATGAAMTFHEFIETVAMGMLQNQRPGCPPPKRRSRSSASTGPPPTPAAAPRVVEARSPATDHHVRSLCEHQTYQSATKPRREGDKGGKPKKPMLKCAVCPNTGGYYCVECSAAKGKIVALCGPRSGRNCITAHCAAASVVRVPAGE